MGGGTYIIRRATYRKSEARKRYEETLKTRASVVVSRLCPQSCLAAEPEGDLALVTSRWSPSCHSCSHFSLWVCGPQQETEAPWEQGGPAPAAGMGRGAEKERGRKRHDGRRDREPRTPALVELVSSPALRGRKRKRYCQLGPVLRCSSPGDGGPGTSEANSEHRTPPDLTRRSPPPRAGPPSLALFTLGAT